MSSRLHQATERRTPLPLTARDIEDLAKLRVPSPEREALRDLTDVSLADEASEALLIHAVFTAGLRAIREAAEARGYAQLAAQEEASGEAAGRRAASGRRPPRADELEDIRSGVLQEVERLLADSLTAARDEGKARVNEFVSKRAPRYRPVLSRLEPLGVTVDPSMKDQDLELLLHRNLQRLEAEVIAEGQAVFAEDGSTPPEQYQERLSKYLETVTDINQSDLAAYVSRRRALLDALSKLIRSNEQGKYSREDTVHSLLMPMRTNSNEIGTDASNLWIIDERLAFHDYLASDKTLKSMSITGSESTKEPDILATRLVGSPVLAAEGEGLPLPSIVVIEIKRPMRNDASEDRDPIQQCLDYVKRVRSGGVLTSAGRPIPPTQDQPAFCYVLADLTKTMIDRCEYANLRPTHDGMGYFGFNEPAKAYIEVMSFDRLVNSATERNRAFFDKLGLPST